MSKPDDIPQDVWDATVACAKTVCRNLPDGYGDMAIEFRAIAKAIMDERKRCSNIAAEEAEGYTTDDAAYYGEANACLIIWRRIRGTMGEA